ncbi:MAG: hypothetical protein AAGJ18_28465 [Bacteroidota bacterium]
MRENNERMKTSPKLPKPDFDARWKEAIEHLHDYFISFFFADLAPLINWKKEVKFLDKELQQLELV